MVEAAGAPRAATALKRALSLRNEYETARAELRSRQKALDEARSADAKEHAQNLGGQFEPRHVREVEAHFDALERKVEALQVAVPQAVDEVVARLEAERDTATGDLEQRRIAILTKVADAVDDLHAAIGELEVLYDSASWVRIWPAKRWRLPLGPTGAIRAGNARGLSVADALAAVDGLVETLAGLPLPGEELEPMRVTFGRSRLGQPTSTVETG